MADLNIDSTTTPTEIMDFTEGTLSTDGSQEQDETFYDNENFTKWYKKYRATNKIKSSIKAWATWVLGLGYTTDAKTQATLDNMNGNGKENFKTLLRNQMIIKKVNGDSFGEVVRNEDTGTLINLKPLDPSSIRVVFDKKGIIDRYEKRTKSQTPNKKIDVNKIFHLVNDRVADEIHGDSVIEAIEWNIEAQEEARRMYRKKVKNSGAIGILEVDADDPTKLTDLKAPIKKGVEDGTFMMVPKDIIGMKEFAVKLNTQELIQWLNYLDDEFYQMIGLPKIIGGASGEIEGDSKVSYLAFEPVYKTAIEELEADLWNQLAIRIKFNLPPSLQGTVADNEVKNTSQVGFQPNDVEAGVGA